MTTAACPCGPDGCADSTCPGRSKGALGCIQAAVPGWMDIETAPRDGTTVLLAAPGRVTAGEWNAEQWPTCSEYHVATGEYLGQYETGECIPAAWSSWDGGFTEEHPPTHWMPLPAAPDSATQVTQGEKP